jgi:hypothetical protein
VFGESIFISVSTILPLDFGNVPTMWYCLFYILVFSIDISDDVSSFQGAYRLVIIVVKINFLEIYNSLIMSLLLKLRFSPLRHR